MEDSEPRSEALAKAQRALGPYIKSRQETAHIRRILTSHLKSTIDDNRNDSLAPPIALVNRSTTLLPSAAKTHGLQKEYLRALKANVKAQQEYSKLSARSKPLSSDQAPKTETASLDQYLSLVHQKQKLERLRILQDHLQNLASKTPLVASFLDETPVNTSGLPRLPADVINSASHHAAASATVNLEDLAQDLEKDVLRAKVQLQTEKGLLEKAKADQKRAQRRSSNARIADSEQMLKALGRTRNELVDWIEEELGKAGDIEDDNTQAAPEPKPDKPIEHDVEEVRAKYARYLQARKHLLEAANRPKLPPLAKLEIGSEESENGQASPEIDTMTRFMVPYLTEFLAVSREQKSLTQQRSHLATSLAKHNKETIQVLDRLGEESHLLATYPPDSAAGNGPAPTFAAEMGVAVKGNPGVNHKAKEWTHAAEAASLDTLESVYISVEDGKAALGEARKVLDSLDIMLGRTMDDEHQDEGDIWMEQAESASRPQTKKRIDIWTKIDGNLGALDGTR